ncbi:MAG: phosphoribosyl transferase [Chloroflexi bacterium]|nr:phosphoribosyl transferase [Chloroflexota bacterium]
MSFARGRVLFEDRYDAGRQLAARLGDYKGRSVVVLAIPNGGVPVALGVALALEADLDLIIVRKIPLPLNPEAGFGALADDGTAIFNEEMAKEIGLTPQQISGQVNQVRAEIRQRSLRYQKERGLLLVSGRTVIIVDDGLASGFTVMAAVASLRRRRPAEIIVAVPVASAIAMERMGKVADKVITLATGEQSRFAVADFYRHWHDISDEEVIQCLKEWQMRRFQSDNKPSPGR